MNIINSLQLHSKERKKEMSSIYLKRLTKELKEFTTNPPPGITLLQADDITW